jgi:hypothetical protein
MIILFSAQISPRPYPLSPPNMSGEHFALCMHRDGLMSGLCTLTCTYLDGL